MGETAALNRRDLLVRGALVGGSFAIGFGPAAAQDNKGKVADTPAAAPGAVGAMGDPELTPWVLIAPDDTVVIRVASPEFGNGAMTQCVALVAEELECDWAKIRTEAASTNRDYVTYGGYSPIHPAAAFFGGRSTMGQRIKAMQQVGASARERLRIAAATRWGVAPGEVTIAKGVLTHAASSRSLRYGEVVADAAKVKLTAEPVIKKPAEWTFLGKASPSKITIPAIVDGSAQYGMDVRLPGMVYAALMQSPVHGGRLKSYNADKVKAMPGVLAVVTVDPDEPRGVAMMSAAPYGYSLTGTRAAVAVIAEHYWQAQKSLEALPVEWHDGPGARWATTQAIYDAAIAATGNDINARVEQAYGDVSAIDAPGAKLVKQTYLTPYCDQAPMEPLNGTALVTADRVEVWHPAQNSQQAFWVASDEAGIVPERVFFHQTLVGGAFGRRLESDDVRMVVAIAKRFPGRPVHTIWSREEMTRQGKYRPMVATKMTAALDPKTGLPTAAIARQASRGHYPRFADTAYFMGCIPNVRVDARELPLHVTPGPYRGPGYNSYTFFQETFIDECAHAAGIDPVEYRLRLLEKWPNPGWAKSLKEVAKQAGWGKKLPRGTAQGVAITGWGLNGQKTLGTCVAVVATVEVTRKGALTVKQLDAAFDTGKVMNRDEITNLIEGGLIFGLNMALNEEMTVKDGRMVEGNFDAYKILRMAEAPPIRVHFGGLSGADRYSEIGEPPVGTVGPAVGNAIFRATGKRLRRQPFLTQDLSWS
ncbi:xanthine dehydrogenase family protein molybdopterin-binding subunit [Sphingomonas jatrophae]|uniref:xanthine dehydrogenase family protein molybdopterin-binding subunit n=1 Tax=Sphingomonas jatrophae TaxID=1166337 RepID=UPI0013F4E0F8|nr:molybdopterin cofactor-binding domain-containing protein [Sphingomonas jatrophae]